MSNHQAPKDRAALLPLIKSLDDAHDDLFANGPVSADQLNRDIEAVYERHRREIKEDAAKARSKVG